MLSDYFLTRAISLKQKAIVFSFYATREFRRHQPITVRTRHQTVERGLAVFIQRIDDVNNALKMMNNVAESLGMNRYTV